MENKTPLSLKEEGNTFFAAKEFEKAIQAYAQAISVLRESGQDNTLLSTLYSNRCACYLGLEQFHKAIEVCILPSFSSFSSFFLSFFPFSFL